MILQALVQLYEQLCKSGQIDRLGWCKAKASYAIDLRKDGSIRGFISLKESHTEYTKSGKAKVVEEPTDVRVPAKVARTRNIAANFLHDNSRYLLGINKKGADKEAIEAFNAAKEKHLQILDGIENETASAVKAFFTTWDPEQAKENSEVLSRWKEITGKCNLVFYVNGNFAHENEKIIKAWDAVYARDNDEAVTGTCIVTGEKDIIARTHNNIKGVPGASPGGASLVSYNKDAFESYEKKQSFNSSVGEYAMTAYTSALNYMLKNPHYHMCMGDTTVTFWAEDADVECQSAFEAACNPTVDNQELLEDIFRKLRRGQVIDVDSVKESLNLNQKFYILGISPNNGRLSVRFFYEDSFGNILQHLKDHYDRMEIVRPSYDKLEYFSVSNMIRETVNKKAEKKKAEENKAKDDGDDEKSQKKTPEDEIAGRTFEAILSGGRYPEILYSAVLRRIFAEQDVSSDKNGSKSCNHKITRGRAAIIKAYLIRNTDIFKGREETIVKLDETCNDIPYVLGREFAVMEKIQVKAIPGINSTIKDRYFNAACSSPKTVFPKLVCLKNSHIKKMLSSADMRGLAIYYEQALTDLQGRLPATGYPKHLNLQEQGQFIIGYYHQIQKKSEKTEKIVKEDK